MQYAPTPADLEKNQALLQLIAEVYQRVQYDPDVDCVKAAKVLASRLPPALLTHAAVAYVADELAAREDDAIAGAGA